MEKLKRRRNGLINFTIDACPFLLVDYGLSGSLFVNYEGSNNAQLAHGQKYLYKEPVMYMAITAETRLPFIFVGIKEYSDYDLLDLFERDGISKAIVISGLDKDKEMVEVRAFIFAARKRFDPGTRPKLLYTRSTQLIS